MPRPTPGIRVLNVRLPEDLHAELKATAERQGVSLNQLIVAPEPPGAGYREPVGGGMPRSLQILRARPKAISRWRGTAVERSASKPQKLWLPPSRSSAAPWARRWRSKSRRFTPR